MTPKEKATSIVDTMYLIISNNGQFTGEHSIPFKFEEAKKCALVAVDEISKTVLGLGLNKHHTEYIRDEHIPYWEEVKQEIEKL